MQSITPCLWFDDKAEEAVNFYVSLIKNSKVKEIKHYGDAGSKASGQAKGTVMTVAFELNGQEFLAMNAGPHFKFSPAISFMINCDTQAEIDMLWEKLCADGGAPNHCGWLTDKYGLSWQIVPSMFSELMQDDGEKAERVFAALMKMHKIEIQVLLDAFNK